MLLTITFRIPPKTAQEFGDNDPDTRECVRTKIEYRIRELVAAAGLTLPLTGSEVVERGTE